MSPYQLTRKASLDLLAILNYTARERGPDAADELELELTTAFENLASLPGLGHRKDDLTARPFYFFLR